MDNELANSHGQKTADLKPRARRNLIKAQLISFEAWRGRQTPEYSFSKDPSCRRCVDTAVASPGCSWSMHSKKNSKVAIIVEICGAWKNTVGGGGGTKNTI